MELKMGKLFITEYSSKDIEKVTFTKELNQDKLIKKYISPDIEYWIRHSENLNRLCIGPGYLIGKENELMGAIKISNLTKMGYLNVDYMLHEKYRNKKEHYGNILVSELTEYLLYYFLITRGIELAIDRTNIASIKCAQNAGYKFKNKSEFLSESDIYVKNRR